MFGSWAEVATLTSEDTRSARWDCDYAQKGQPWARQSGRVGGDQISQVGLRLGHKAHAVAGLIEPVVGGDQISEVGLRLCRSAPGRSCERTRSEETRSRWDCAELAEKQADEHAQLSEETRSARWDCDPNGSTVVIVSLISRKRPDLPPAPRPRQHHPPPASRPPLARLGATATGSAPR